MKRKDGFKTRIIGDEKVLVPIGSRMLDCQALVSLNETGAFVWDHLEADTSEDALVTQLAAAYDVSPESAQQDVSGFLDELFAHGLVE